MKLYLISSVDSLLDHWSKALKKFHPITMKEINELNRPNKGIIFWHDQEQTRDELIESLKFAECSIIVLSMSPDFKRAQELLNIGVMGYGNAMMHESHLLSAYQALGDKKVWLHPDFISSLITQLSQVKSKNIESHSALEKLSQREKEVALLLAQGLTHNQVAEKLKITVRTIKAHCTAIYEKLEIKDRLALSILLRS